jgi:hypothetical protein
MVAGVEAGVLMTSVDPWTVVTVKVDGDGMYSVATDPLEVMIWTDETVDGIDSVAVPPDGVMTDETIVGTEVGISVTPDGVETTIELGVGTDEMYSTVAVV